MARLAGPRPTAWDPVEIFLPIPMLEKPRLKVTFKLGILCGALSFPFSVFLGL